MPASSRSHVIFFNILATGTSLDRLSELTVSLNVWRSHVGKHFVGATAVKLVKCPRQVSHCSFDLPRTPLSAEAGLRAVSPEIMRKRCPDS